MSALVSLTFITMILIDCKLQNFPYACDDSQFYSSVMALM